MNGQGDEWVGLGYMVGNSQRIKRRERERENLSLLVTCIEYGLGNLACPFCSRGKIETRLVWEGAEARPCWAPKFRITTTTNPSFVSNPS